MTGLAHNTEKLAAGFTDAPIDAAYAFRAALHAMARPGRIETLSGVTPPAPVSPAAGALILTLCDPDTALFLAPGHDTDTVRRWVLFHTGARLTSASEADFALGTWAALQPLDPYRSGTPDYPDRSVTLIVECDELRADRHRLTGPGIETEAMLRLPETRAFTANRQLFPRGFDCYFTAGSSLAALPRSTRIEEVA
ncbi:MAG: phosphonate C-P lyase system protein PhnH [Rhodobacter sp.]|nr:phosphonate C-P lyase system protein PhnH [Rhodobacter sp.]